MSYRIGIDIGGTFTDFAIIEGGTGDVAIHKLLTTPRDPSIAVLDGIDSLLRQTGVSIADVTTIIHGSTLVTNAVIQRRGARTGMLVTKGFREVLEIAQERRYDLYDLRLHFPDPIVPRALHWEVSERTSYDGAVLEPVDLDAVRASVRAMVANKVEAVAICFLNAFVNPANEHTVRDLIAAEFPQLYVSASADVFSFIREYERWTTTAMNAFSQPMVDRYLGNLEQGLATRGFSGAFYVMASSGGILTTETARRFPVRMLESGPAAGVLMSTHHGHRLGIKDLLSFDMGGTTAKGAIVQDGVPRKVYEIEVARVHEFKPGSGLPVKIPVIDMIEIGAGGGSIAELDGRGLIRVGPNSAGAEPGPACYGRGGTRATLTDANVVLGYLDPDFFLGGKMQLDKGAAEVAVRDAFGREMALDTTRAAWGIHEIINEDVARAFRVHASEIGFDYRKCTMVAFGGSGPAHALRVARKLKIPRVVLPVAAGVMSAFGMLVSPLSFQVARTNPVLHADLGGPAFAALFEAVASEARDFLLRAGVQPADIRLTRHLDVRYHGQGYEIELELPRDADMAHLHAALPQLFASRYEEIFSLSYIRHPIEIINWKVEAQGPAPAMSAHFQLVSVRDGGTARKGTRCAYFPEADGFVECPVFDRYALSQGMVIDGPALIEEHEATLVIGIGDRVTLDSFGNLIADIERAGA